VLRQRLGNWLSNKGFTALLLLLSKVLEKAVDIVPRFRRQLGSRVSYFFRNGIGVHGLCLLLFAENSIWRFEALLVRPPESAEIARMGCRKAALPFAHALAALQRTVCTCH
jgi:hypothetical protein